MTRFTTLFAIAMALCLLIQAPGFCAGPQTQRVQTPIGNDAVLTPVQFRMTPLPGVTSKGITYKRWMCTHTANGKTARFEVDDDERTHTVRPRQPSG